MSPKVADKELVASASAVLAAGKEKWFGQFTKEGIDKTSLSSSAQSALGEDVKAFQRLSALSKVLASGKATEAQKSEAAELVKKLEGANSAEGGVLEAAKSEKAKSASMGASSSSGTPTDEDPKKTEKDTDKRVAAGAGQGDQEIDYTGVYAMIGDPQDGGGQGAGGQLELTPDQLIAKLRETKKAELIAAADDLETALKSGKEDRSRAATACLSIYARCGDGQEFGLAMSGFRSAGQPSGRVTQSEIERITGAMESQLKGATVLEDAALKPALTTLGDNIKTSIDALNELDREKDKVKWDEAQNKLQQSLDIYVSLKDFDSRNRQYHVRDAYDNMNRARAILGLTEIKLTMESRVNSEISRNELQYNRNTADSNIEAGRAAAGNMTLQQYTVGIEGGELNKDKDGKPVKIEAGSLTLNEAAGGSKTLREYAQNSAQTERALLERDRARNERGRESLRDRKERIRLTRETIGEVNGTVRETRQTINQFKKEPLPSVLTFLAIKDAFKGKPPRGY